MKEWILSFVAIAVLLIILELILSEGTTKKYISGTIRLILVFTLLSPIIAFVKNGNFNSFTDKDLNQLIFSETNSYDLEVGNGLNSILEKKIENSLSNVSGECEVKVIGDNNQVKKIEITIQENVINESEENILIIEKIREEIKKIVTIDESSIIIKRRT